MIWAEKQGTRELKNLFDPKKNKLLTSQFKEYSEHPGSNIVYLCYFAENSKIVLMLLLCQRAGNLWFLVICWWAPMKMNFWGWVRQGGWLQLELNYYLMIQSSYHFSPPSEISMFYQYMRKPLRIHHGFSLGRQFTPHTDTNQYMCTQVL